jgi:alpha-glucosidase
VVYYGVEGSGVHLPGNFHLLQVPWQVRQIATLIDAYEAALPADGWPNWVLSNHDKSRLASRLGAAQARVAAMLLLTLRGTPILYYGDELGMCDGIIPPECVQDPWEKRVPGLGLGRDPARTPMLWDTSPKAGFTTVTPWLPLAANAQAMNVAVARADPTSMLTLYRRLLALRRATPALAMGAYRPLAAQGDILAYSRTDAEQTYCIVLNLGGQSQHFDLGQVAGTHKVILSTYLDRAGEVVQDVLPLRRDEGVILEPV